MREPTIDRLRELLSLDEASGVLTWRVRRNGRGGGVKPGDVAGTVLLSRPSPSHKPRRYLSIGIDGGRYLAHRVVMAMVTSNWPPAGSHVDHIDRNSLNNAPANLRITDARTNAENRSAPHTNNKTGLLGVSKKRGRYLAQLASKGKTLYLGTHETPEAARQTYLTAKAAMHPGYVA